MPSQTFQRKRQIVVCYGESVSIREPALGIQRFKDSSCFFMVDQSFLMPSQIFQRRRQTIVCTGKLVSMREPALGIQRFVNRSCFFIVGQSFLVPSQFFQRRRQQTVYYGESVSIPEFAPGIPRFYLFQEHSVPECDTLKVENEASFWKIINKLQNTVQHESIYCNIRRKRLPSAGPCMREDQHIRVTILPFNSIFLSSCPHSCESFFQQICHISLPVRHLIFKQILHISIRRFIPILAWEKSTIGQITPLNVQ